MTEAHVLALAAEERRATEAVLAAHQAGLDIAEWVAHVLAAAAAQLGSAEALLANRPGSWEAGMSAGCSPGPWAKTTSTWPPGGRPGESPRQARP